jgi:hypothetical protein
MNNDSHLTEQEALNQAAAEGIYFEDFYKLSDMTREGMTLDGEYKTRDEAETARQELDNPSDFAIVQGRRQKP